MLHGCRGCARSGSTVSTRDIASVHEEGRKYLTWHMQRERFYLDHHQGRFGDQSSELYALVLYASRAVSTQPISTGCRLKSSATSKQARANHDRRLLTFKTLSERSLDPQRVLISSPGTRTMLHTCHTDLKNSTTSATSNSGFSYIARCPPRSCSLQNLTFAIFSTQLRGYISISCAKALKP